MTACLRQQHEAATIHSLPDGLLASCLELLPQQDRYTSAALVCKRIHALTCNPKQLSLSTGRAYSAAAVADRLRRLRALLPWLLKHGASLQELELSCEVPGAEAASLLDGCLAAAASKGSPSRLHLAIDSSNGQFYAPGSWAASLQHLQHLSIEVNGRLHLLASLGGASRLLSLDLKATRFSVSPALHLAVEDCAFAAWLPAAAAHLSGLQVLELPENPGGNVPAAANQVLTALPQLRGLWLEDAAFAVEFPQAAAALSQLGWMFFDCFSSQRDRPVVPPSGPWQQHLRCLVVDWFAAKGMVPFLGGCPRLEELTLASAPVKTTSAPDVGWQVFWRWAAAHPPLKRLRFPPEFEYGDEAGTCMPELLNAAVRLAAARPELHIECLEGSEALDGLRALFRRQLLAEWE
ncbi:hypothetical protein ABPG75_010249 [Micractinium tetrahymenae]